jgi:hypothetical protein
MKPQIHLSRADKLDMRSVLERSLQRAERRKAAHPDDPSVDAEAEMLAKAVADLNDELARP